MCNPRCRVAQNARAIVKGVVTGVTRALFRRRAPLTPQIKRASARRREEKVFRGVYMNQQVAALYLGWGQASTAPSRLPCDSAGDSSRRSPGYDLGVSAKPPGQAAAAAVGRRTVAPTGASRLSPWLSRHTYPSTIPPSRRAGWFTAIGISCWQRKA